VVLRGLIDIENVFATGGSDRGVLSCRMIGRSDKFRAAASVYPVINWYSWVLTANIGNMDIRY
jgi:acylaminoacyl-peptidase